MWRAKINPTGHVELNRPMPLCFMLSNIHFFNYTLLLQYFELLILIKIYTSLNLDDYFPHES